MSLSLPLFALLTRLVYSITHLASSLHSLRSASSLTLVPRPLLCARVCARVEQTVIQDICKRMGKGMADFAKKKAVDTHEQYALYCHYVAGLVGHGLSRLFSASGLESDTVRAAD